MKVYKYSLRHEDEQEITLPKFAEILCVQTQDGFPFIWAIVDENASEKEQRTFHIYGTGHPIKVQIGKTFKYIGTFQTMEGMLVWHLFEVIQLSGI